MQTRDQLNRIVQLKETPKRIISLVPSQTELLVDLGLEDYVVGVTKFCVHPEYLRRAKTIVGGTKDIKLEKIRDLRPDIILCNKEENTQDIVEACSEICPVHVSDIYTIDDSLELINQYGMLFSIGERTKKLIHNIQFERNNFQQVIEKNATKRVAYFIWRDPWMVAANNTYINFMLKLNRFENVFENVERYPEVALESLKDLKPDLILLSSEPYPFKKKHIEEVKNILPNVKIMLVDGEAFSWYGSRFLKSFKQFRVLHDSLLTIL